MHVTSTKVCVDSNSKVCCKFTGKKQQECSFGGGFQGSSDPGIHDDGHCNETRAEVNVL